ncbi:MAG: hypothetical protein HZB20_05305 [Chloroflexi bacterium]|nr:hypothetical protein [Chloroflexota bacterium]
MTKSGGNSAKANASAVSRCVSALTDVAGDDDAGINADVQRHALAEPFGPAAVEGPHAFAHGEGGAQGAVGVVFVGHWRAEHGHHRVADEFINVAFVLVDRFGQFLQGFVGQVGDFLRVERFAEGGEAGEVGKHDGDLLAFALQPPGGAHFFGQFARQVTAQAVDQIVGRGLGGRRVGGAGGAQAFQLGAQSGQRSVHHRVAERGTQGLLRGNGGF